MLFRKTSFLAYLMKNRRKAFNYKLTIKNGQLISRYRLIFDQANINPGEEPEIPEKNLLNVVKFQN